MRLIGSFDSVVLAAVVADLEPLVGARVQRVVQPAGEEIALVLRGRTTSGVVLCSVHPRWARLHRAASPPAGGEAGPFGLLLRSRLEHARLTAVRQIPFERVVTLAFDTDRGPAALVAELMGRHSNLILLQGDAVAGALRPAGRSARPVVPGRPYAPPPAGGPTPADLTPERLRDLLASEEPLDRRLAGSILGISPTMAREIASRAGVDPQAPARTAVPAAGALMGALAEIAAIVEGRAFAPVVYLDDGTPVGFAPFPLRHVVGMRAEPVPTMSEAVARVVARRGEAQAVEALRASLASAVRAALDRVERTRGEVDRTLQEAAGGEEARRRGELLLAYASRIAPGAPEATVPGYDGQPVTIPLDPGLTPVENAQRLFARYTKLRRARPALEARRRALEEEARYLASALTLIEQAQEAADLEAMRDELAGQGYLRRRGRRAASPARPPARVIPLPSGASVLVGRTNEDNDRLTFTVAAPEELWFHARGVPGAHVVLRTGGREPTEEEVEAAAAIAAWFSGARGSGRVAVDCTRRRHVRKPRGSRPGLVVYDRERTLHVRPQDPAAPSG